MIFDILPDKKVPDTIQRILNELQQPDIESIDVFQGIMYLCNQGMLTKELITGTHYELNKVKEISLKLGQYMYVLSAQKNNF